MSADMAHRTNPMKVMTRKKRNKPNQYWIDTWLSGVEITTFTNLSRLSCVEFRKVKISNFSRMAFNSYECRYSSKN